MMMWKMMGNMALEGADAMALEMTAVMPMMLTLSGTCGVIQRVLRSIKHSYVEDKLGVEGGWSCCDLHTAESEKADLVFACASHLSEQAAESTVVWAAWNRTRSIDSRCHIIWQSHA